MRKLFPVTPPSILGVKSDCSQCSHGSYRIPTPGLILIKKAAAAEALVANGSVIVCQHADSTGAPAAVQKLQDNGTVCYSVGYNIDMLETAPTAALTSATNNWSAYYKHAFETFMNGGEIESDWAKGYSDDAVAITTLGPSCAEGTAEKVAEVEEALRNGSMHVFDTSTFTVGGRNRYIRSC